MYLYEVSVTVNCEPCCNFDLSGIGFSPMQASVGLLDQMLTGVDG